VGSAIEVIIVGGGLAGLSAAVYLGRSLRRSLLIESGHSMATWEPQVQNYLGFPDGISGRGLLEQGRRQAELYGVPIQQDEIHSLAGEAGRFILTGKKSRYESARVLLATGLTHLPPDIPGVRDCLGHSLFFCKDCDAYRIQDRHIAIIGSNTEAADYALAMLAYSGSVMIATNGSAPLWDEQHRAWLRRYQVPVRVDPIEALEHDGGRIRCLRFALGPTVEVDAVFTTRGDRFHTHLAEGVGARLDETGELIVDEHNRTTVPGLYGAGCVTPANCQMIIAAGQGAAAAQAINRDLFLESLREDRLPVRKAGSSRQPTGQGTQYHEAGRGSNGA
jgi:thioredoxin reductase (NADPH)